MKDIIEKLYDLADREESIDHEKEELLRSFGWSRSSDYPGSLWLWGKSFPESKTQWVWRGSEKVPHPPFTINGATTEIALTIERSWQELWDDSHETNQH